MKTVSVILSTFNEEKNIKRVIQGIWDALIPYTPELQYEVIVVDDGSDRTSAIALSLGARVKKGDRKGLGQAIIDGINIASGDIIVCMDADGSHDPKSLPDLINPILRQGVDMTIGSRYCKGGGLGNWSLGSKIKSVLGAGIMSLVTGVRDSNSGFFAFRREAIKGVELKPTSWKVMLEVLFKGHITVKREVPIVFGERWEGESKNNIGERARHAWHLIKLLCFKWGRFINFALVGGIGAIWYFGILYALTEYAGMWYGLSAVIATFVAITNNYLINHYYTFRHIKKNNRSLLGGYLKYILNSAIGDGLDWCMMVLLTEVFGMWYMLSAFLASGVACVVKYLIASKWIWGGKGKKASDADYEWHSYYKGLPWQMFWKRTIARAVKRLAGEAGNTLEIGCGSSPICVIVDHNHYVGLDRNRAKVKFMQDKIMDGAEFNVGSALNLPYPREKFDTVLLIETIEHFNNSGEVHIALAEAKRVLKRGGNLIIATPNFGSWTGRMQDKLYGIFQKNAYAKEHKVKFTPETLKDYCGQHGFRFIESIIPMGSDMVVKFRKGGRG